MMYVNCANFNTNHVVKSAEDTTVVGLVWDSELLEFIVFLMKTTAGVLHHMWWVVLWKESRCLFQRLGIIWLIKRVRLQDSRKNK